MSQDYVAIPPEDFLKRFAPPVNKRRGNRYNNIFKGIPAKISQEADIYIPLIDAVNDHELCPGLTLVATPSKVAPPAGSASEEAVDVGLYPVGSQPQQKADQDGKVLSLPANWSAVELCVVCKTDAASQDPFDDYMEHCEPNTYEKKRVLEQILSSAGLVFQRQQRICVFMILLLGHSCCILRFDRSGIVMTQEFNYQANGSVLVEFLWRFSRWNAEQRGHDPSAELVAHDSALGKEMKRRALEDADTSKPGDYPRQYFADSLRDDWSWWKLRVDDERGTRSFLVGRPHFRSEGVAGRGTRGYVAVDADNIDGPFYYLKDAWRIVKPGAHAEGTILSRLNGKGVEYIPTLECHGDVRRPEEPAPKYNTRSKTAKGHGANSMNQATETQGVWEDLHRGSEDTLRRPFKTHIHYRMVVREVGKPLEEFKNGRQLVQTVYCCVYAHSQAYEAGVLHRDISPGNILLYFNPKTQKWSALLNDWEFSRSTEGNQPEELQDDSSQTSRSIGTWQFMSTRALDIHKKSTTVEDELESFFHVLLYVALRFLVHNCADVPEFISSYFDACTTFSHGGPSCGSLKKLCMLMGRIDVFCTDGRNFVKRRLLFSAPPRPGEAEDAPARYHPLNEILATILKWLKAYHEVSQFPREKASTPPPAAKEHEWDDKYVDKTVYIFTTRVRRPPSPVPVPDYKAAEEARDQLRDYYEELAGKLRTHRAILSLLGKNVKDGKKWPLDDKVEDQLCEKRREGPKAAGAKKDAAKGTGTGGAKRKSEDIDEPESAEEGRPKRRKSQRVSRRTRREM
ncbi:hypothetical protein OH77DRAFT_1518035 [Trametes cingulata]|nr:hypothetical protein OH77DRAFT_1518035 [Trametes cingulata]